MGKTNLFSNTVVNDIHLQIKIEAAIKISILTIRKCPLPKFLILYFKVEAYGKQKMTQLKKILLSTACLKKVQLGLELNLIRNLALRWQASDLLADWTPAMSPFMPTCYAKMVSVIGQFGIQAFEPLISWKRAERLLFSFYIKQLTC